MYLGIFNIYDTEQL